MSALSDVDIKKELGKNIIIEKFSEMSLTPLGYDLRIGAIADSNSQNSIAVFENNATVCIKAKSMVQIMSEEFVWLSQKVLATIHSRGTFSAKGLILNSTTVDPNWSGQMAFSLFNFSDEDIEIKVGERFATVVFYYCYSPTSAVPVSRAVEGLTSNAFSLYNNSEEISKISREFENKKQVAQSTIFNVLRQGRKNITVKWRTFDKFRPLIIILLVFSIIMMFALPLGLYDFLRPILGLGEFNLAYSISNFAVVVSLLTLLRKSK